IRPRRPRRGKHSCCRSVLAVTTFQSAPDVPAGGNCCTPLRYLSFLFQSAPDVPAGGNVDSERRLPPSNRFNPPPTSPPGETDTNVLATHVIAFQSAPD